MLVESGTTVSLSELRTLIGTFSSDPSMEFRISTPPGLPARKTQTLIYVSNRVLQWVPNTRPYPWVNGWVMGMGLDAWVGNGRVRGTRALQRLS